jgi:hypothetical protein
MVPGLALLLTLAGGCGKKGDPLPPILLVPAPTTDLSVVRRGDELLLDLAYPQTTAAGTPLPRLAELAVWQLVWRAPQPAAEPVAADERQFLAGARPVRMVEGEELGAAVAGDRIRLTLDVPAPEAGTSGLPMVTLAVKTEGPSGEESVFSNRVSFPLVEPPAPPTGIEAEAQARGVRVRWSYPEAPEVEGFNVYRRKATERSYGAPLRTLASTERLFLDESALFGESYIYTVAAVARRRPAVVESPFAEEVEVVYRDVFAPPVPQGLVALAEGGRVRLVWQASEAADRAGYRVYRRGPDTQEFRPVTQELVTGTDFADEGLPPGATYTYRVTALDRLGNESPPSETATAWIR